MSFEQDIQAENEFSCRMFYILEAFLFMLVFHILWLEEKETLFAEAWVCMQTFFTIRFVIECIAACFGLSINMQLFTVTLFYTTLICILVLVLLPVKRYKINKLKL